MNPQFVNNFKPCDQIKYFFCTKHEETQPGTDNEVGDVVVETHRHEHTHGHEDNSTDTK